MTSTFLTVWLLVAQAHPNNGVGGAISNISTFSSLEECTYAGIVIEDRLQAHIVCLPLQKRVP